jgi:nitrate reductase gamma subunit
MDATCQRKLFWLFVVVVPVVRLVVVVVGLYAQFCEETASWQFAKGPRI